MRTICVLIEDTIENFNVVEKISNDFPCFYNAVMINNGYIEIAFNCREEDAKRIEERLASIV